MMERSAANAKGDKSQKADSSKDSALRIRPVVDKGNELGDPLRELVPSRGCRDSACSPSMESVGQRMAVLPAAQRRQAAMALQRSRGNRFMQAMARAGQVPVQAKMMAGAARGEYERTTGVPEAQAVQRQADPEIEEEEDDEEVLQGKSLSVQRKSGTESRTGGTNAPQSRPMEAKQEPQPNRTGMPDRLKEGIESLSGIDMSDVRVHANSDKPAKLDALAYTQGNQIYLGPGQERHLPHEAWHAVQQKQGRVRATNGGSINDDTVLEREADGTGTKAITSSIALQKNANQTYANDHLRSNVESLSGMTRSIQSPIQLQVVKGGTRNNPRYFSTETTKDYDTKEEAEREDENARKIREAAEKAERPPVVYNFQQPKEGPPVPETSLASELLKRPLHFGPVITTGGDINAAQVQALAQGHESVSSLNRSTQFTGRNTYAAVFSHVGDEFRVHRRTGSPIDLGSLDRIKPSEIWSECMTQQGPPPVGVQLPPRRKRAHAEALACYSDAFSSAAEKNATDLLEMSEACDFDPDVKVEEIENLSIFLAIPPVGTTIATNRAMCGIKGRSGHKGGCTQEMAETASEYEDKLAKCMDPSLAKVAFETGMATFGVSVAGASSETQGNPSIMTRSWVDVDVHNAYDWRTGQGKPLSKDQQRYLITADPQKFEERKKDREQRSSAEIANPAESEEETLTSKRTKFDPQETVTKAPQVWAADASLEGKDEESKAKINIVNEYMRSTTNKKEIEDMKEAFGEEWWKKDESLELAYDYVLSKKS